MLKVSRMIHIGTFLFSTGCASFIDTSFGTNYHSFFDAAKTQKLVRKKLGKPNERKVTVENEITYQIDVFEVKGKLKKKTDGYPQLMWAVYTLGLSEIVFIPVTVASNINKLSQVNRLVVYYDELGEYQKHILFDVNGDTPATGWY